MIKNTMTEAFREEIKNQPLVCIAEFKRSSVVELAETGRITRTSFPISGRLTRAAVKILIYSPIYWLQNLSERLKCAKEFSNNF